MTALGTVAGGVIGYGVAKIQSDVEIRRLEGEADRLRLTHEESHLQHRQALYHNLLDSAFQFHLTQGGVVPQTDDEKRAWMRQWEHHLNAVRLFGTKDASDRAHDLEQAIALGLGPISAYAGERQMRFLAAYEAFIQAVRADTAPDRDTSSA